MEVEDRSLRVTRLSTITFTATATANPWVLQPKHESAMFSLFQDLAPELRERVYAFALASNRPIRPHLCDSSAYRALKFHDDNQQVHNATNKLLGITLVSRQIRAESFSVFHSTNVFEVDKDTSTYFDRPEHLGRFHMIRQVRFQIMHRLEHRATEILRGMKQYLREKDAYEKSFQIEIALMKWKHDLELENA